MPSASVPWCFCTDRKALKLCLRHDRTLQTNTGTAYSATLTLPLPPVATHRPPAPAAQTHPTPTCPPRPTSTRSHHPTPLSFINRHPTCRPSRTCPTILLPLHQPPAATEPRLRHHHPWPLLPDPPKTARPPPQILPLHRKHPTATAARHHRHPCNSPPVLHRPSKLRATQPTPPPLCHRQAAAVTTRYRHPHLRRYRHHRPRTPTTRSLLMLVVSIGIFRCCTTSLNFSTTYLVIIMSFLDTPGGRKPPPPPPLISYALTAQGRNPSVKQQAPVQVNRIHLKPTHIFRDQTNP